MIFNYLKKLTFGYPQYLLIILLIKITDEDSQLIDTSYLQVLKNK